MPQDSKWGGINTDMCFIKPFSVYVFSPYATAYYYIRYIITQQSSTSVEIGTDITQQSSNTCTMDADYVSVFF
jgi:hypothetical protein